MIERIRWNWRHFASGRAGLRFRERYRLHQSRRRGGFDIVRISYILGAAFASMVEQQVPEDSEVGLCLRQY
jgi:hypothetical protein